MTRVGVMHLVDTLAAGGAERVAVNLVNALPRSRYAVHLCTTRADGALDTAVRADVGRLRLHRRWRWDAGAAVRLIRYVREHDIRILHGHSTAVVAAVIAAFGGRWAVVWHDHYGRDLASRSPLLARLIRPRIAHVIAVSDALAKWAHTAAGFPAARVSYIPNFVTMDAGNAPAVALPGTAGARIVCVANFRPQKDHATLLRAFAYVAREVEAAHLVLVGGVSDRAYYRRLEELAVALGVAPRVTFLPDRTEVPAILRGCDIGVLSSGAEGLPLALLEYGAMGLAAVATDVGQCAAVLDGGCAGRLVPPRHPAALASVLVGLLRQPAERAALGARLRERVARHYSAERAVEALERIYARLSCPAS